MKTKVKPIKEYCDFGFFTPRHEIQQQVKFFNTTFANKDLSHVDEKTRSFISDYRKKIKTSAEHSAGLMRSAESNELQGYGPDYSDEAKQSWKEDNSNVKQLQEMQSTIKKSRL